MLFHVKHSMYNVTMNDIKKFKNDLFHGVSLYGIHLNETKLSFFETYYNLLVEWNSRMNLVSKRDINRFVEYHLLDSLKVASGLDMFEINRMMDFGSGAGLPGIPLALAFPHIETFLVDSRKKRCAFLETVITSISSLSAKVVCSRIENLPDHFNDYFDIVITRGTVKLDTFFLYSRRFIHSEGYLVSIKGDSIDDEIMKLQNLSDSKFFNIKKSFPKDVFNVRKGNIITISHK